MSAYVLIAKL